MTAQKHLKQLVRARMQKTGESYAAARRQIVRQAEPTLAASATRWHMPGNVPATTALRVLLAHAGVYAPHTGAPFSEALLFGIAGGIGIGVFSFYYKQEDVATFFLGGRHEWHDDLAYMRGALERLGVAPSVSETSSARAAEQQLCAAIEQHGPCVAWVDAANLSHRAMPLLWDGGGYHVITVYEFDPASRSALIGDLADAPIAIAADELARARGRIKKQAHRLLAAGPAQPTPSLGALVDAGLRACHARLREPAMKNARASLQLGALRSWAQRMHGSNDRERWELVFRPGANLWRGLCSIHEFIEYYGTGGGLGRPLFADFLAEAGAALSRPALAALAARYAELGQAWSALADAALPDDVPLLREAKQLYAHKAEIAHSGQPTELRAVWDRLGELGRQAAEQFPLAEAACAELRAGLSARILALYEAEVAAQAELGQLVGG